MALFFILFLQFQLFRISQSFNVVILVSDSTPSGLTNYLWKSLNEKFQRDFTFIITNAEDCDFQIGCIHLPSLAIDATFSTFYSFQIRAYSEKFHFLYINLNHQVDVYGKYEFFGHISYDFHYQALNQLTNYFGWKKFIVIANSAVNPILLSLKKQGKGLPVFCTDNEDRDIYDLIIGREVKPNGIGNIIILNDGRSSPLIVKSLSSKMMLKNGYGVIMGSDSIWGNYTNDGLVFYAEEGLENATSYSHYQYLAIEKVLKTVLQFIDYTTHETLQILEKKTINHSPFPNFSIINIQNGKKIKVGSISSGKILIGSALVYPGNSTIIPNLPRVNITISLADGISDPGGTNATYNIFIRWGNYFAFRIARQSGLLSNFNLNVQSTDCGVTLYSKNFSRPCFAKLKDKIGVVHLSAKRDPICLGDIMDFRALNISAPIIANGCEFTPELMNKTIYPEFMTISKEESYIAGIFPELANIFGWKKVAIVHRPEWSKKTYETMVIKLSKLHIEVANNSSYYFTTVYTTDQLENYKNYFLDIINSKCRIVMALVDPRTLANLMISFYDLGMRKGDIIFLIPFRYSLVDLLPTFQDYSEKYSNYFFELIELISEIVILLLCSIAYIPFISILFSVFLCKESAGNSITDSFVSNDCYTYCWTGFHLSISLLCLIVLLLYMALSIYFQPLWQLYHPIFNIILHPKAAVYKSALYFIMIGVNKNLYLVSKALEGMIYSFMLLALAFVYWKIRIYNYPRMNMWAIVSVFIVIWSNVISSVHSLVGNEMNVLWELGLIIGWIILGVVGMILQTLKFKNLLTTEKGIEMGFLFKFSLGSKICATEINVLKVNNASYSKDPLFASSKSPDKENFAGSQWFSGN